MCMGKWYGALWLVVGLSTNAVAHVVSSFYAEQQDTGIEILFDVGYAIADERDDPNAKPRELQWLKQLNDDQHTALRRETESYLRRCLRWQIDGQDVDPRMVFPDFEQPEKQFTQLLNGLAYYRVLIENPQPEKDSVFQWRDANQPDLVVRVSENQYTTLTKGQDLTIDKRGNDAVQFDGASATRVAFQQGFLHVVPKGLDHILFLAAMFFAIGMSRHLLAQSLSFTVAHTVTLGLCSAGIFVPSPSWVEPIIAASIAWLALENILRKQTQRNLRLVVIFLFGLIHGCGFAQVLAIWIQDGGQFALSLVSANIGVEIAQISVLLALWMITWPLEKTPAYPMIKTLTNVAIFLIGAFWTIERVLGSSS